jgi:hypothetical protein
VFASSLPAVGPDSHAELLARAGLLRSTREKVATEAERLESGVPEEASE